MLKLNSLLLFSEHPKALIEFYKKVFEKEPKWEEGEFNGFDVGPSMLFIGPHDKVHGKSKNPERMMFNLETKDVKEEFQRMKKLGAKVIAEPYLPMEEEKMTIATLADPDGNYFQLASPM